jgi:hypothetical protein
MLEDQEWRGRRRRRGGIRLASEDLNSRRDQSPRFRGSPNLSVGGYRMIERGWVGRYSGPNILAARKSLSSGYDEVVFGHTRSPILEPMFGIGLEIE